MVDFDLRAHPSLRAAVVASALAAGLMGARPALATFPGRNGDIALSQFGDLYLLTPEGDRRQLTSGPDSDYFPTFSADGKRIAFTRDPVDGPRRLYTMRADGTGAKPVPGSGPYDFAPAFAPGGRKLVFQSSRHISPEEIWTIRSDGTHARALTFLGGWNGRPSYSPDGRKIVFARGDDGVWAMNAGGGNVRRLAKGFTEAAPSFSPNGRRIAFAKNNGVYTMRVDGSDKRRLTRGFVDREPTYSPNGKRIVFFRYSFHETGLKAVGTFIVDANGQNLHKIVDGKVGDRLDWQALPR